MRHWLTLLMLMVVGIFPAKVFADSIPNLTISSLISQNFVIVAATADAQSQYLYLMGADASGARKGYVCQIQFGPSGAFRGCLALP